MNRRRQPFFYALLLLFAACACANPLSPSIASAFALLDRICFNAASIVLAAAPFVLAGAFGAFLIERLHLRGSPALFAAALAPGCDCSMNGFMHALTDSSPRLAGAALAWGAACNPVALATTAVVFGPRALLARVFGAAVVAFLIWLLWTLPKCSPALLRAGRAQNCNVSPEGRAHDYTGHVADNVERGLRALAPAALTGAGVPLLLAAKSHAQLSPLAAALTGALLSPCSSADPVLASVVARDAPAQAAFMLASQCLDVRMLWLVKQYFGIRSTLLAAIAGAAGCIATALVAR